MGAIAAGFLQVLTGVWQLLALVALLLPAALVRAAPSSRGRVVRTATAQAMHSGFGQPAGMPAVRPGGKRLVWQSAGGWHAVLADAAKVGTALTAACVLSLALAALARLAPPQRWLEGLLAMAALWVALSNLVPLAGAARWKLAVLLGAVQGLACAAAFRALGGAGPLPPAKWLGFALGLALAQWAVLALVVPLAWALRRNAVYRGWVFRGGSVLIALLAAAWLVQTLLQPLWLPMLAKA